MNLAETWKEYSEVTQRLSKQLGRTNNPVGEYAEYLVNMHLDGTLSKISAKGVDIEKDGKRYQVKSRKLESGTTTRLGVIRSWDFDYLVVVIFDMEGNVKKACIVPAIVAKEVAAENSLQNGHVITTHINFFNCRLNQDITDDLRRLNNEDIPIACEIIKIQSRGFKNLHKIKRWAIKPKQTNHRIIRAYLQIYKSRNVIKKELFELCSNPILEPGLYVENVKSNFNSMRIDAGNSHGKVFYVDMVSDEVFIYPQVYSEIKKYFPYWCFNKIWPFELPESYLAVSIKSVVSGESPILYVNHYKDSNDWYFSNLDDLDEEQVTHISLYELVRLEPSILELASLEQGQHAWRNSVDEEWTIEKY